MTKLGNMVIGLDEILVNTVSYSYNIIRNNWDKYGMIFKDFGDLSEEDLLSRTDRSLDAWLLKDELAKVMEEDKDLHKAMLLLLIEDIYSEDIYSELYPTMFSKKVLSDSILANENVTKVYIVENYYTDFMKECQERFINRYFNHEKIEYILLPLDINKADYIAENLTWNLLVDDNLENIYRILENKKTICENKEFLIPDNGYNQDIKPEAMVLAMARNVDIVHYGETKSANIK